MIKIKHVSIDLKNVLSGTLEKDLSENEAICPVCNGTGVVKRNNVYGIVGDTSEVAKKKHFPYNHQALSLCPNCYNGVIRLCEYCGKPIGKNYISKCGCEQYKKKEAEKQKIKYQKKIDKAKKVDWCSASYYVYDEQSDKYFLDEDEFTEYYWDLYQEGIHFCKSFDEYFNNEVPKVLWCCKEEKIKLDAGDIVEYACEDLHEDAYQRVDGMNELQKFLDEWCSKQSGTITYYPDYKEYVEVTRGLFNGVL